MFDSLVAALFKYSPRVFARGELVVMPVLPPLLLAALALGAVALVVVLHRALRTLPVRDRAVLGTLRAAALLLLLACLLRPALVVASAVPQRNVLAVLLDDSRSMRLTDIADGGTDATRLAAVQRVFADTGALMTALADRFAVRTFRFADDARPVANAAALDAAGTRSDLAAALTGIRDELAGLPLAGVIVVSDGADNGRGAHDEALLALRARRVPVYTVGVGRERFARDVAIERVIAPASTLADASLFIEADLRVRGVAGEKVTVAVEADGRLVASEEVTIPASGDVVRARVRVPPLEAKSWPLTVRARPLANETVTENNEWHSVLDVRPGPERILYMEGEPRPEFAFIRRAVANDSGIQLVALLRSAERKFLRLGVRDSLELVDGFPATREELFRYRAIVLGSIESSFFTADQMRMLAEFVSRRGGGLLALGGRSSFAEGGWTGTPLADILPVTLGSPITNPDTPPTELLARATLPGQSHPVLQLRATPRASAARIDSLPPLTSVNRLGGLRPGATLLLAGRAGEGRTDVPLLSWQRYGRGLSVAFAAQDSWLWRMHATIEVEDETHRTFWRQMLRWLVDGVPDQVMVEASPRRVAPGEAVRIEARVADGTHVEVNDAAVVATVTAPSGQVTEVPLDWSLREDGSYAGTFRALEAGLHRIDAISRRGRDTIASQPAALLADDRGADVEQAELRAALLRRIADATGGRYYPIADASALADDVIYTDAGVTVREAHDLWDMPAVFLLLALLLGAEWGYRRWRGLA